MLGTYISVLFPYIFYLFNTCLKKLLRKERLPTLLVYLQMCDPLSLVNLYILFIIASLLAEPSQAKFQKNMQYF